MTIPSERTRAVIGTREFMLDLIAPAKTPKVPRAIRNRALRCLRHYPSGFDMARTSEQAPFIWGPPE